MEDEAPQVFDAFIAGLRLMEGTKLEIAIAKKMEVTLQEAVSTTIAAGETPEGEKWAPKRKGGGRAYPDAAATLTTKATGSFVRMTLTGDAVYGHFGRTGKQVARPMLPDAGAGTTPLLEKAQEDAAREVFEEAFQ